MRHALLLFATVFVVFWLKAAAARRYIPVLISARANMHRGTSVPYSSISGTLRGQAGVPSNEPELHKIRKLVTGALRNLEQMSRVRAPENPLLYRSLISRECLRALELFSCSAHGAQQLPTSI